MCSEVQAITATRSSEPNCYLYLQNVESGAYTFPREEIYVFGSQIEEKLASYTTQIYAGKANSPTSVKSYS